MADEMDLTDDERVMYDRDFALTTDAEGRLIFWGLTIAESVWWTVHKRNDILYRRGGKDRPTKEDRQRASVLYEKHQVARGAALAARNLLNLPASGTLQ